MNPHFLRTQKKGPGEKRKFRGWEKDIQILKWDAAYRQLTPFFGFSFESPGKKEKKRGGKMRIPTVNLVVERGDLVR